MKNIYNPLAGYLIHLLVCALNGKKPEEKPETVSFEQIYALALKHDVANLAYYAVEKLEQQPEPALGSAWKEIRDKAIVKGITQIYERDQIITALTAAGIDICPLKGCLLKEMYPQQDMRMMADLDILMKPEKASAVDRILTSMGYRCEVSGIGAHDEYFKKPVMHVEMHYKLMDEEAVGEDKLSYYRNVWERLMPDSQNTHLYRMSWNDFYIYFIAHLAKHYYMGGTGIRSIMDIHIFLARHGQDLDQQYLKTELEKIKLWDIKEDCEKLAAVWFGDEAPDERLLEMTEFIIQSGTYGTIENALPHRVEKGIARSSNSKFRYLIRRLFPPCNKMQYKFPVVRKYPFLLPFCWIIRIVRCITDVRKRKNLKNELELTRNSK